MSLMRTFIIEPAKLNLFYFWIFSHDFQFCIPTRHIYIYIYICVCVCVCVCVFVLVICMCLCSIKAPTSHSVIILSPTWKLKFRKKMYPHNRIQVQLDILLISFVTTNVPLVTIIPFSQYQCFHFHDLKQQLKNSTQVDTPN